MKARKTHWTKRARLRPWWCWLREERRVFDVKLCEQRVKHANPPWKNGTVYLICPVHGNFAGGILPDGTTRWACPFPATEQPRVDVMEDATKGRRTNGVLRVRLTGNARKLARKNARKLEENAPLTE